MSSKLLFSTICHKVFFYQFKNMRGGKVIIGIRDWLVFEHRTWDFYFYYTGFGIKATWDHKGPNSGQKAPTIRSQERPDGRQRPPVGPYEPTVGPKHRQAKRLPERTTRVPI